MNRKPNLTSWAGSPAPGPLGHQAWIAPAFMRMAAGEAEINAFRSSDGTPQIDS